MSKAADRKKKEEEEVSSGPFLMEVPSLATAIERAEDSLRLLQDQQHATPPCSCPHLRQFLPHALSLQFCRQREDGATTSSINRVVRPQNPVHALHLASQLAASDYSLTVPNVPSNVDPMRGFLSYGEEEERALAATSEGLSEYWHALLRPRQKNSNTTKTPMVIPPPLVRPVVKRPDLGHVKGSKTEPMQGEPMQGVIKTESTGGPTPKVAAPPLTSPPKLFNPSIVQKVVMPANNESASKATADAVDTSATAGTTLPTPMVVETPAAAEVVDKVGSVPSLAESASSKPQVVSSPDDTLKVELGTVPEESTMMPPSTTTPSNVASNATTPTTADPKPTNPVVAHPQPMNQLTTSETAATTLKAVTSDEAPLVDSSADVQKETPAEKGSDKPSSPTTSGSTAPPTVPDTTVPIGVIPMEVDSSTVPSSDDPANAVPEPEKGGVTVPPADSSPVEANAQTTVTTAVNPTITNSTTAELTASDSAPVTAKETIAEPATTKPTTADSSHVKAKSPTTDPTGSEPAVASTLGTAVPVSKEESLPTSASSPASTSAKETEQSASTSEALSNAPMPPPVSAGESKKELASTPSDSVDPKPATSSLATVDVVPPQPQAPSAPSVAPTESVTSSLSTAQPSTPATTAEEVKGHSVAASTGDKKQSQSESKSQPQPAVNLNPNGTVAAPTQTATSAPGQSKQVPDGTKALLPSEKGPPPSAQSAAPPKPVVPDFLLSEFTFRQHQTQEESIRTLRRSIVGKRNISSSNKKSKAGGTTGQSKKRKIDHRHSHLIDFHPILNFTPLEEATYFEKMKLAVQQVDRWMEQYRLARKMYWRSARERLAPKRTRPAFGSFGQSRPSTSPFCHGCIKGSHTPSTKLIQCLDCNFVGCDQSGNMGGVSHVLEHMALSGHHLGVTHEPVAQIFCFDCDVNVRHEVFDQEMLRIDLEHNLKWLAWNDHPVQRSFDAMQFRHIPDVGIIWNGMIAAYPPTVPAYHLRASQICHQRYFSFEGSLGYVQANDTEPITDFAKLQSALPPSRRFLINAPVGMYNLGNTCFQSAVFQCLLNCRPLQNYFLRVGHNHMACPLYPKTKSTKKTEKERSAAQVCLACEMDKMFLHYYGNCTGFNVVTALSDLAHDTGKGKREETSHHELSKPKGDPIVASDILAATWKCPELSHLAGYDQNDAHEFLHGFLDMLGKHTKRYRLAVSDATKHADKGKLKRPTEVERKTETSDIVQSLFEGKLRSVLLCTVCGEKRKQSESFLSISLPLSKEVQRATEGRPGESTDGQGRAAKFLSVERQLRHFTLPESLSDPVDCPACRKKTPTKKQHVVSKLPRILCLHLKRFDDKKKINDFVSFPMKNLNMGSLLPQFCEVTRFADGQVETNENLPTVEAELLYDLIGTVNHFGTLQSGHYVSNVKVDENWYHCNDAHVGPTSEEAVMKSDAYLLFYARR